MSESTQDKSKRKMENDLIRCYCGKWAKPALLKMEGIRLRGWRCACGEQYIHPEDSLRLSAMKKMQAQTLTATVTQTGNSLALRIPKVVVDAMALQVGRKLRLILENPKKLVMWEA